MHGYINYCQYLECQVNLPSFRSLQAAQANLHCLISEVSEKLNALSEQNASLNSQVDVKSKLIRSSNCGSSPLVASPKAPDPTETINEYMERQKRKCNPIVRNVPESPKQGKSEQVDDDTAKLSELFHKEFGIERAQIKKFTRLGKRIYSRPNAFDFTHS